MHPGLSGRVVKCPFPTVEAGADKDLPLIVLYKVCLSFKKSKGFSKHHSPFGMQRPTSFCLQLCENAKNVKADYLATISQHFPIYIYIYILIRCLDCEITLIFISSTTRIKMILILKIVNKFAHNLSLADNS